MEKNITIMGIPMDLGQRHKGVDLGPDAIRYAGVKERLEMLGCKVTDIKNIPIGRAEQLQDDEANLRNLKAVAKASEEIARQADQIVKSRSFRSFWEGTTALRSGALPASASITKTWAPFGSMPMRI
ncbi:hypothetical protein BpJC4_31410 [Weizmannia acidilactici]|nr:hypothetical protein BpJC4_31410 [Weizmannia acidilactici]